MLLLATVTATAASAVATTTASAVAAPATGAGTLAGAAPHLFEAVAAVHRTVATRLEGYLRLLAAVATYDVEQLSVGAGRTAHTGRVAAFTLNATGAAAVTAALGLGEAALGVELLIVGREDELRAAVRTRKRLVCKWHLESLLNW
jgi:hypothetical protein